MPTKNGRMTPQEAAFVGHMAVTGDANYSAKMAGYSAPGVDGWRKMNNPVLAEATRKAQITRLNNDLLPKSLNLLEQVLLDEKEATRNRLTAAQIVLKYSLGQAEGADAKEPHEMTPAELQARIDTLRREVADRARPVIDHEPPAPDVFE